MFAPDRIQFSLLNCRGYLECLHSQEDPYVISLVRLSPDAPVPSNELTLRIGFTTCIMLQSCSSSYVE